jgi:hypothetical protein
MRRRLGLAHGDPALQADRATPALTLKMLAVAPRKHDL